MFEAIKRQFESENRVFKILKKIDEDKREEILKEMIFQYLPKKHLHKNPRQQHDKLS